MRDPGTGLRGPRTALAALSLGLATVLSGCGEPGGAPKPEDRGTLPGDALVQAEIAPGQSHRYSLPPTNPPADGSPLFLRLNVMQRNVDVALRLLDGEEEILSADRLIQDWGEEWLAATVPGLDEIRIEVFALPFDRPPGHYELRLEAFRPATARDQLDAEAFQAYFEGQTGKPEVQFDAYEHALALWRGEADSLRGQGEVYWNLGRLYEKRKDWAEAESAYRRSLEFFQKAGDDLSENLARNSLGKLLLYLGRPGAREQYQAVIAATETSEDLPRRARALHGLAQVERNQGNFQKALDLSAQADVLWAPHEMGARASALHQFGVLYLHNLHSPDTALPLLEKALDTWPVGGSQDSTLNQLGQAHLDRQDSEEARRYLEEALRLRAETPCKKANTLSKLADAEQLEGESEQARARLDEASALIAANDCTPKNETTVCMHRSSILLEQGDAAAAATAFDECRALFAERGDEAAAAAASAGLGRALSDTGDTAAALEAARQAIEFYGNMRAQVRRADLRTSFFTGAQDAYDLLIDLLQAEGVTAEAFEAAEEAKARSLLDRIQEAGAGIRGDADPELLRREQDLQGRLRRSPPGSDRDALIGDLEEIRGQMRRTSPQYARLTQPETLTLAQVQTNLAPGEAMIELRLGGRQGHLWWVTRNEIAHFPLPAREKIEAVSTKARKWLESLDWSDSQPRPLCWLSREILGPVADRLAGQDLIFVPDGVLHEIPLAALPLPSEDCAATVMTAHSVVTLPSAAILVELREGRAEGERPNRLLAVVADPVYEDSDPRLPPADSDSEAPAPPLAERSISLDRNFERLAHADREARAIEDLVPEEQRLVALGTEAHRDLVLSGDLADFRILHFAVHGVLEPRQPLLSHLALAARDEAGRPREGRLFAHEVYNLRLPADLVVLSACETGSGRQHPGEGMVSGLFRGFLYAGARRLLVSLWPVDDAATGELMGHFYRGLLEEGLPPARALQQAQTILSDNGALPYHWAGFVLQGDPAPLPPFSP